MGKASMVGFTLLSRSYYYLRRRSPGPPFPPDHRQAGERGAITARQIYLPKKVDKGCEGGVGKRSRKAEKRTVKGCGARFSRGTSMSDEDEKAAALLSTHKHKGGRASRRRPSPSTESSPRAAALQAAARGKLTGQFTTKNRAISALLDLANSIWSNAL